jgi:hypothetical protein
VPRHGSCAPEGEGRPRHEVADIFRAHGAAYRAAHVLTPEQRQVMWAIEACRTAVFGGHVDVCADCGHEVIAYNSCCNRHCPKCQALAQARWLEGRRSRILPVGYFHVVFTMPGQLRAVALRNPRLIYDLLFRSASRTLLDLGRDPARLGAELGVTAVLHTWNRSLELHPHVHCVVTAGGLSPDGQRWVDSSKRYLFPVRVLGALFRGKLLDGLVRAYRDGELDLPENLAEPARFERLLRALRRKSWVVYAKRPFAGPEQVFAYLGRYTHRVALSNRRLLSITDHAVTVATRDGKSVTMSPNQFIQRFLLHVLPKGFVKIRHYGLMASGNVNTSLARARQLLEERQPKAPPQQEDQPAPGDERDWRRWFRELTGIDLAACPVCGSRRLHRELLPRCPRPDAHERGPPALEAA